MKRTLYLAGLFLCISTLFCARGQQLPIQTGIICTDAGSTDAYACTSGRSLSAYTSLHPAASQPPALVYFKPNTANTGAATLAIDGLAAWAIVKNIGGVAQALANDDLRANVVYVLKPDVTNTRFEMVSPPSSTAGGGATTMTWIDPLKIAGSTGSSTTNYPLMNLPSATGDAPSTVRIGTSPNQYIILNFEEGDLGSTAVFESTLHPGYQTSQTITVKMRMNSSASNNTNVRFIAQALCIAAGASLPNAADPWSLAETPVVQAVGATNNVPFDVTISGIEMTGCVANDVLKLKIRRTDDHVDDTSVGNITLLGGSIQYPINIQ